MHTLEKNLEVARGLITTANDTTGKTDATLTDAVASLVEGFGKGGVDISSLLKNAEFAYEPMLNHTQDITLNMVNAETLISLFGNVPIMCNKISVTISSKCKSFQNTFRATSVTDNNLKKLKIIEIIGDTSKVTTYINAFANRRDTEEIRGELNLISSTSVSGMFTYCSLLKEVRFVAETIKLSIAFTHSPNLSDDSIQSIIDGLADMTGQDAKTLTFHADVKAKLTETQIATITNKNWTLA